MPSAPASSTSPTSPAPAPSPARACGGRVEWWDSPSSDQQEAAERATRQDLRRREKRRNRSTLRAEDGDRTSRAASNPACSSRACIRSRTRKRYQRYSSPAIASHGNLTWNCYNLLVDVELTHDEVTLISAPLYHIAALAQSGGQRGKAARALGVTRQGLAKMLRRLRIDAEVR